MNKVKVLATSKLISEPKWIEISGMTIAETIEAMKAVNDVSAEEIGSEEDLKALAISISNEDLAVNFDFENEESLKELCSLSKDLMEINDLNSLEGEDISSLKELSDTCLQILQEEIGSEEDFQSAIEEKDKVLNELKDLDDTEDVL